jgi:RimJ/RimL family protein N-acetyltransferase
MSSKRWSQPLAGFFRSLTIDFNSEFEKIFSKRNNPSSLRHPIEYFGSMQGVEDIEVRPFSSREEYELMLDYFYKADDPFLRGMGVDRLKLPERDKWLETLLADHEKPGEERDRFYLIWIFRGERVGHSSINKIVPGIEAFIHLHLWNAQLRRAGLGTEFVCKSANFYFERFNLQKLVCEPWAENPAPNRVLEKLGFTFVRRYRTIPGVIAYEQEVNRYELRRPNQTPQATALVL